MGGYMLWWRRLLHALVWRVRGHRRRTHVGFVSCFVPSSVPLALERALVEAIGYITISSIPQQTLCWELVSLHPSSRHPTPLAHTRSPGPGDVPSLILSFRHGAPAMEYFGPGGSEVTLTTAVIGPGLFECGGEQRAVGDQTVLCSRKYRNDRQITRVKCNVTIEQGMQTSHQSAFIPENLF